jgi:hypothetical protein
LCFERAHNRYRAVVHIRSWDVAIIPIENRPREKLGSVEGNWNVGIIQISLHEGWKKVIVK